MSADNNISHQQFFSQVADHDVAKKILEHGPVSKHSVLWRGEETHRPYTVGDEVDLSGRSLSEDRSVAYDFAFGDMGDADNSTLLEVYDARGVRMKHSVFPEQKEWVGSGRYKVEHVGSLPDEEIDQHVRLRRVR